MIRYLLILFIASLGSTGRVINLTEAPTDVADWKIVASSAGGPVGSWPRLPSEQPVGIRFREVRLTRTELYFSLEILNDRDSAIGIPLSRRVKPLVIAGRSSSYTQLLIELGTAGGAPASCTPLATVPAIELFGNAIVPQSVISLAPHERVTLLLKTNVAGAFPPGPLCVHISGSSVTLVPVGDGYKETSTWIPALLASSMVGTGPK